MGKCRLSVVALVLLVAGMAHASLLVHYDFEGSDYSEYLANKGTGTHALELSTGTRVTYALNADGESEKVLEFFANDQYAAIGNSDLGSVGLDTTVALWFKGTADNGQGDYIIGGRYLPRLMLNPDGATLDLDAYAGASGTVQTFGTTNVDDGEWHCLAFVFDGEIVGGVTTGVVKLYVDGELDGSNTIVGTTDGGFYYDNTLWLGARDKYGDQSDVSNETQGYFDDVRIYDEALSINELNAIYGVPEPMTIALLAVGGLFIRKRR